jgi:hypothetical protein
MAPLDHELRQADQRLIECRRRIVLQQHAVVRRVHRQAVRRDRPDPA